MFGAQNGDDGCVLRAPPLSFCIATYYNRVCCNKNQNRSCVRPALQDYPDFNVFIREQNHNY